MTEYHGYSYPPIFAPRWIQWLWTKFCCPRGWHLWDEVRSGIPFGSEHYLFCDACGVEFFGLNESSDRDTIRPKAGA